METILLVDDEPVFREILRELLREQGYTVLDAGNVNEALEMGRQQSIALLIADVSLPGINGCELAARMVREQIGLKVLFISGHAGSAICAYYNIPTRDFHFLEKPFSAAELMQRVRQVLDSRETLRLDTDASRGSGSTQAGGARA